MISEKNNCLIAEFLGYKKDNNGNFPIEYVTIQGFWNDCSPENLEYGESFDWLMPVVEKIKNTDKKDEFNFNIDFWNIELLYNEVVRYINKIGAEN